MKKVEAYIRPEKLYEITEIMRCHQLNGLTITQVMGCGDQKGWKEYVRGSEVDFNFIPKIKIEMVVSDEKAEAVISGIIEKAQTGMVGDGKIFISNIEDAIRIRTRERGLDAISESPIKK